MTVGRGKCTPFRRPSLAHSLMTSLTYFYKVTFPLTPPYSLSFDLFGPGHSQQGPPYSPPFDLFGPGHSQQGPPYSLSFDLFGPGHSQQGPPYSLPFDLFGPGHSQQGPPYSLSFDLFGPGHSQQGPRCNADGPVLGRIHIPQAGVGNRNRKPAAHDILDLFDRLNKSRRDRLIIENQKSHPIGLYAVQRDFYTTSSHLDPCRCP